MEELDRNGEKLDNLDRILSGGTTVPEWIIKKFKNDYGVHLIHAWGMTETSPLGTANSLSELKTISLTIKKLKRCIVQEGQIGLYKLK